MGDMISDAVAEALRAGREEVRKSGLRLAVAYNYPGGGKDPNTKTVAAWGLCAGDNESVHLGLAGDFELARDKAARMGYRIVAVSRKEIDAAVALLAEWEKEDGGTD